MHDIRGWCCDIITDYKCKLLMIEMLNLAASLSGSGHYTSLFHRTTSFDTTIIANISYMHYVKLRRRM